MPEPLAPVMPIRSPRSTWRSTGPRWKPGALHLGLVQDEHDVSGSIPFAEGHLQGPLPAGCFDRFESGHGPLKPSGSRCALFGGVLASTSGGAVVVPWLTLLPGDTAFTPAALRTGARLEVGHRLGLAVEGFLSLLSGAFTLHEVGVEAATEIEQHGG